MVKTLQINSLNKRLTELQCNAKNRFFSPTLISRQVVTGKGTVKWWCSYTISVPTYAKKRWFLRSIGQILKLPHFSRGPTLPTLPYIAAHLCCRLPHNGAFDQKNRPPIEGKGICFSLIIYRYKGTFIFEEIPSIEMCQFSPIWVLYRGCSHICSPSSSRGAACSYLHEIVQLTHKNIH